MLYELIARKYSISHPRSSVAQNQFFITLGLPENLLKELYFISSVLIIEKCIGFPRINTQVNTSAIPRW
jgi:hypothetical protein